MVSRDYTKEVGFRTADRPVPRPIAYIVYALVAAAGWLLVTNMHSPEHTVKASAETDTRLASSK